MAKASEEMLERKQKSHMLTDMSKVKDLKRIYQQIRQQPGEDAALLAELLKNEIKRRSRAGVKKTSPLSRREQNRLAQQRFRDRKKNLTRKPK